MDSPSPLITVITVVRNAAPAIAATMRSVVDLKGSDVEYIVVDGASTDGTLDVIRSHSSAVDVLVSEPDRGIYDAMNKGLARARGLFVIHINAGDRLLRIPRQELLQAGSDVVALSFPVIYDGEPVFTPTCDWRLKVVNTLHHQGTFYKRSAALSYDTSYRTFADMDLNQRLAATGRIRCLLGPVAAHAPDGVSHQRNRFAEIYSIVARNQGAVWVVVCWLFFKVRGLRWRLMRLSASLRS